MSQFESPALNALNLVVRDMGATLAFYRLLGLDVPADAVWSTASGMHHVTVRMPGGFELEFDSPALARAYNAGWQPPAGGRGGVVIGFAVASREAVEEGFARMTGAGYAATQPPHDAFWGSRYAVIVDPDGNHVGVMSPVDPERMGEPPTI
ncbi:MAG: VOC family protein [Chloroflexi bacterium]|nr:VOC family protein [Chloroflexota bacterium]MDA1002198.1 VOC family protein [Chloroflexota bacterium]